MIDMRRTAKERRVDSIACGPCGDDEYGYGLRISLEQAELEKLGIVELPEVGEQAEFKVKAKVTGVSQSDSAIVGSTRSVSLQIVGIEPKKEEKRAADVLFG